MTSRREAFAVGLDWFTVALLTSIHEWGFVMHVCELTNREDPFKRGCTPCATQHPCYTIVLSQRRPLEL